MVVDVFISDMLIMNGHDDVVYVDKPTHRQPTRASARSVTCTLQSGSSPALRC